MNSTVESRQAKVSRRPLVGCKLSRTPNGGEGDLSSSRANSSMRSPRRTFHTGTRSSDIARRLYVPTESPTHAIPTLTPHTTVARFCASKPFLDHEVVENISSICLIYGKSLEALFILRPLSLSSVALASVDPPKTRDGLEVRPVPQRVDDGLIKTSPNTQHIYPTTGDKR